MPPYYLTLILLIVVMFVCAITAIFRAKREDIPAVVEALARWWRRK